jgi:PKD repeat protein
MRSFHLLALAAAMTAATAACGGDNGNGNGPDNADPTANFTAPACQVGVACTFTDASTDADGTIASRSWTFQDGSPATSTEATQAVTFASAGTKNVTLTVTDNEGADASVTRQVTVTSGTPANQPPVASFTFECSSQDCTFTNTSTDADGTIVSYSWDFDDGSPAVTTEDATHTFAVTELTTFTVGLTVTDDDGASTTTTNDVNVAPPATLNCSGTPNCSLVIDVPSTVTVTLVSEDCEVRGNTFRITSPFEETLFDDGCFETPVPQSFPLQGGAVINAGTEITAEVISGGGTLVSEPAVQVTGSFAEGWTLMFDDGVFADPGGPDFNDLIITIVATPQ